MQAILRERIAYGTDHMVLADQFSEIPGAPFARECERHFNLWTANLPVNGRCGEAVRDIKPFRPLASRRIGVASLTPSLAKNSFGCFLPDLTRFTTMQCGEARHK